MPEERKANIIERLLFGPDVNKGLRAASRSQEKGMIPFDSVNRYVADWATPVFPINTAGTFGGRYDYAIDAGDMIDSSLVMVCLNWLMRVFPMARCRVVLETEDGVEPVKGHPLTRLLKRPNPVYSGVQLWRCTVLSYNWAGNAYWRKVRNASGQVIQLWYEPHWTIRPRRASGQDFVSYYEVYRDNRWVEIPREDVVHFRWVLDPRQQMLGLGPIDSALREVYTDQEATRYTAVVLRKLGVLGGVVTPVGDDEIADPEQLKAMLQSISTGDERGSWGVFSRPLDIHQPTNDPAKMNTRLIHMNPEERVAGLIGIHPSVVGLGAGLEHNTYNNAEEAARAAYANNIKPAYDSFAEEIDMQLVSDFSNIDEETVEFDVSRIDVLKGDMQKIETSAALLWNANAITRSMLKIRIGEKPAADGSDDGYKHELVPGGGGASDVGAMPGAAGDGSGDGTMPPAMGDGTAPPPTPPEKALLLPAVFTNGHGED